MLQIWSLPCSDTCDLSMETSSGEGDDEDKPGMRLELALCLPAGAEGDAKQLAWCPRGGRSFARAGAANDGEDDAQPVKGEGEAGAKSRGKGKGRARTGDVAMDVDQEGVVNGASHDSKLGLLAGTFSDGSLSIFAVPSPDQVRKTAETNNGEVVYGASPLYKVSAFPLIVLCELQSKQNRSSSSGCRTRPSHLSLGEVPKSSLLAASTVRVTWTCRCLVPVKLTSRGNRTHRCLACWRCLAERATAWYVAFPATQCGR